ncbi:GNAT family N-acetyltransferase [Psychrobacillus sp. FSL H8-0484]|uniref:GNAT family N-acetyltransferase n=1 Tax=Psychrobacillus sp. FSL H8-0484 TaxID=2921390 RepID=UPI0030FB5D75
MIIREATLDDVSELALLMEQLGYPTSSENMQLRFNNIETKLNYHTLVAEYEGNIVGMVGLSINYTYEIDGSYARILAFVVNSSYRNKGIGTKLVQEAEEWASRQGAIAIALNSGNRPERIAAHKFYTYMGYEGKSTGFVKNL